MVYDAVVEVLKAPKDDRFQVITEHPPQDFIFDPSFLGIQRSKDCVFIQVTLNAGRSVDQKRAFYKAIADGLHERLNLRREDVFIGLVEVSKENWSFGNGERNTRNRFTERRQGTQATLKRASYGSSITNSFLATLSLKPPPYRGGEFHSGFTSRDGEVVMLGHSAGPARRAIWNP